MTIVLYWAAIGELDLKQIGSTRIIAMNDPRILFRSPSRWGFRSLEGQGTSTADRSSRRDRGMPGHENRPVANAVSSS